MQAVASAHPLAKSLAPAIRLAAEGFSVHEHYRRMARFRLEELQQYPAASDPRGIGSAEAH